MLNEAKYSNNQEARVTGCRTGLPGAPYMLAIQPREQGRHRGRQGAQSIACQFKQQEHTSKAGLLTDTWASRPGGRPKKGKPSGGCVCSRRQKTSAKVKLLDIIHSFMMITSVSGRAVWNAESANHRMPACTFHTVRGAKRTGAPCAPAGGPALAGRQQPPRPLQPPQQLRTLPPRLQQWSSP